MVHPYWKGLNNTKAFYNRYQPVELSIIEPSSCLTETLLKLTLYLKKLLVNNWQNMSSNY